MTPAWPHDVMTTSPRSFTRNTVACLPVKLPYAGSPGFTATCVAPKRARARRVHGPGHEPAGRRGLLEVGGAIDLPGGHGVAGDDGRLLGEHDLQAARLEAG